MRSPCSRWPSACHNSAKGRCTRTRPSTLTSPESFSPAKVFTTTRKIGHGPALFILAEPVAQLLGAKNFSELTETQLRLTPVIAGSAMILLFGAGVEWFGFIACLVAALLFAFAPLPLYYSRYFIHETLFVAATLGLILSGRRMLKTNSFSSAALAGFCAALMLACKETAVLHFLALGLAAAIGWRCSRSGKIATAPGLG